MTPPALTPMRLAKLRNAQELVHDVDELLGDMKVTEMSQVAKEQLCVALTTLDRVQTLLDGALEMGL